MTANRTLSPDTDRSRRATDSGERYLLVKHSQGWNVDRCCRWLEQQGKPFDWCYPVQGDSFPDASDYTGIVIFGGAGSANDCQSHAWVRDELQFIEDVLVQGVNFLGICLGGQMLARVLGAKVSEHPESLREVGFYPVYPTEHSGDFLQHELTVMQWHGEGFELPDDCVHIATGEVFPNQGFRYRDNVFAIQFHPEVNPDALAIWQDRNRKRENRLDEDTMAVHMAQALKHDEAITAWFNGFLQRWTGNRQHTRVASR